MKTILNKTAVTSTAQIPHVFDQNVLDICYAFKVECGITMQCTEQASLVYYFY